MFADQFGINLAVFVVAQLVAWGYLRTGLVGRGVTLLVGSFVLADVALVARFAYLDTGDVYVGALLAMQALAVFETMRFVTQRTRRRLASVRARRAELVRTAFLHYLRNDLDSAARIYARLVRSDPWDLPVRIGFGTVLQRAGELRGARRQLRAARNLDQRGRYSDLLSTALER